MALIHARIDNGRFNPRAREGRDDAAEFLKTGFGVSIHAPARGATRIMEFKPLFRAVSIHAPARGATLKDADMLLVFDVSIHAPARGATNVITNDMIGGEFQSTRPRGARHYGNFGIVMMG